MLTTVMSRTTVRTVRTKRTGCSRSSTCELSTSSPYPDR